MGPTRVDDRGGIGVAATVAGKRSAWGPGTVGCCWALMLLVMGAGGISLGWMLVLAPIVSVEKAVTCGDLVARSVGGGRVDGRAALVPGTAQEVIHLLRQQPL